MKIFSGFLPVPVASSPRTKFARATRPGRVQLYPLTAMDIDASLDDMIKKQGSGSKGRGKGRGKGEASGRGRGRGTATKPATARVEGAIKKPGRGKGGGGRGSGGRGGGGRGGGGNISAVGKRSKEVAPCLVNASTNIKASAAWWNTAADRGDDSLPRLSAGPRRLHLSISERRLGRPGASGDLPPASERP